MLKVTLLLQAFCIISLNAKFVRDDYKQNAVEATFKHVNETSQRYLYGTGSFLTPTERDAMKFAAYVFQTSPSYDALTMGVVLNRAWVITPSAPVDGKAANTLGVTVCGASLSDPGSITVRVKENVKNPDCGTANPLIECVSLLRICPSIAPDHAATLVPALTPYRSPTVAVNVVVYQTDSASDTKLFKITKNIGDLCECEDIINFVVAKHACLTNDPSKYVGPSTADDSMTGYIVTDTTTNEVIGFLVNQQSGVNGEVVLHLETVRTFINNVAVVPAYYN